MSKLSFSIFFFYFFFPFPFSFSSFFPLIFFFSPSSFFLLSSLSSHPLLSFLSAPRPPPRLCSCLLPADLRPSRCRPPLDPAPPGVRPSRRLLSPGEGKVVKGGRSSAEPRGATILWLHLHHSASESGNFGAPSPEPRCSIPFGKVPHGAGAGAPFRALPNRT